MVSARVERKRERELLFERETEHLWLRFCNLFYKQILQNRSQTSIFSLAPIFVNLFSIKICKKLEPPERLVFL